MNDYAFGNFICSLREQTGYTQADIAQFLGVTPAAVSKWENGESKPRTETLFKLADILGVRAEELIAGRRLGNEPIDPATIQQIYQQYAYITQPAPYTAAGVKFRRMLAWGIDWIITAILFSVVLSIILEVVAPLLFELNAFNRTVWLSFQLLYPALFALRDLIGFGRSLGKRITGLAIVDKRTARPAKRWQRLVRNLFMFMTVVDWIVMLVKGQTVGDLLAHTAVIPKKQQGEFMGQIKETARIRQLNASFPGMQPAEKRWSDKRLALTIIGTVLGIMLALGLIVLLTLQGVQNTEQYQVAYTYLVNSEAYRQLGGGDTRLTGYSIHYGGQTTATFTFSVNSHLLEVHCQKIGDEWVVVEPSEES